MRGHRLSKVSVCLTLAIRASLCLAADVTQEADLGSAEPIGTLLLVSAAAEATCVDQICLRIKVLERTIDKTSDGKSIVATAAAVMDSVEFNSWIQKMEADKSLKTLSEPTMTLLSGRTAKYSSEGQFRTPAESQKLVPNPVAFGTFVTATATAIESNRLRVAIELEQKQLDFANIVDGTPGISRRRVQSTVELQNGQTIVFGGMISSRTNSETKAKEEIESVTTITATRVRPISSEVFPVSAKDEARVSAPTPFPAAK